MNADPRFGTPRSKDASIGSDAFDGSEPLGPSNGSGSGSSSVHRSARRKRRSTTSGPTFGEALASGWGHALGLGDYVRSLIGVRTDRAQIQLRRKVTQTGFAVVAGLGVGTIVIAASLRLVYGLSDGLGVLFGGRPWLGDLSASVLLLGGLAGAAALYVSRWEKKELEKHIEKYDRYHREHRAQHGDHISDPPAPNPG
jgi:hypothetical protein